MLDRLDVFLLVIGLTLPIFTPPSVRAGSVGRVGDSVSPADDGAATTIRWLELVRLRDHGEGWLPADGPPAGDKVGQLSGEASVSLQPLGGDRQWSGREEALAVSVPASVLVAEFAHTEAAMFMSIGDPVDGETMTPPASRGNDDPPLTCDLRHDHLGVASGRDRISLWRLIFFLAIVSAAGAGSVWRRPTMAGESDRSVSGMAVGDEAVLDSPGSHGVWVALDDATLGAILDAHERSDLEDIAFLLARGRMIRVRNGTRVEVLGLSEDSTKICIRNGPQRGVEVWVQRDFVRRVRVLPRYNFSYRERGADSIRERAGP